MRVISVNVGLPRAMEWEGRVFESGIGKAPVEGRVAVRRLNLDGDGQADLQNHGGALKAVYAYPFEHYPFWRSMLGELPMGALGENLTLEGMTEGEVCVGDRYRIGTAEFAVTMPREPCFKLAALRGTNAVVRTMLETGFSGWYFAVDVEGEVGAGDAVSFLERDERGVRIADLTPLLTGEPTDLESMARAVDHERLSPYWRAKVARRLAVPANS